MLAARHISRRLAPSSLRRACATASSSATHNFTTTTPSNDIYHHKLPTSSSLSPSSSRTFASTSTSFSLKESYEYILVERRFPENNDEVVGGGVGIITLNRPKALNALCDALFEDLIHAAKAFDADDDIGCIVITGSGKAFAAGEFIYIYYISCVVYDLYLNKVLHVWYYTHKQLISYIVLPLFRLYYRCGYFRNE